MSILSQLCSKTSPASMEEVKALLAETPIPSTRNDLEVVLQNNMRPGASFLTIIARTVPDMVLFMDGDKSKPNPYRTGKGKSEEWHLFKVATVNCMVMADYAKRVNKVREALGLPADFTAEQMTWGMHRQVELSEEELRKTCLVDHYYVPCQGEGCKHKFVNGDFSVKVCPLCGAERKHGVFLYVFPMHSLGYYYEMDDGTFVDPRLVNPWLKPFKVGKQGLDEANEVRVRKYSLDNILRLSANGLIYTIEPDPQHLAAA